VTPLGETELRSPFLERGACARRALVFLLGAGAVVSAGAAPLPRSEFHAECPFLVAAPSVLGVFEARRWRDMIAAAREPLHYEASATNFKRESIIVVTLPRSRMPIADASVSTNRPERFDPKTGTLTLWYDVKNDPSGETTANDPNGLGRRSCVVTWTEARAELQQVVARTSDGNYIAGARVAPRPKKHLPKPQ